MSQFTVSLLTSSTDRYLSDIPKLYEDWGEEERPDAIELYVFRECDLDDLPVFWDMKKRKSSVAEMLAALSPEQIHDLARHIAHRIGDTRISALATYLPEITSMDLNRKEYAVKALTNVVLLADQLGVDAVEMVAGRHDEECTYTYEERDRNGLVQVRDCDIVFSCKDYAAPQSSTDADLPMKLKWLILALGQVYRRVRNFGLKRNVQLFLELEPGHLFVLSRPAAITQVLAATRNYLLPSKDQYGKETEDKYPFISFNCDIGHCLLTTVSGQHTPGSMWSEVFADKKGRIGTPVTRLKNFHISDHPYNRMHLDRPPTSNPNYATFRNPIDFAPWLNCVHCVAERGRKCANVSIELEAETRTEPLWEAVTSVRHVFSELSAMRRDPGWVVRNCGGCPDFDETGISNAIP